MFKVTARTILELGSELISSDIIAFYELIKNGFDAKTKNGVDIRFEVVLRRNVYLKIKQKAEKLSSEGWPSERKKAEPGLVAEIKAEVLEELDVSASENARRHFQDLLSPVKSWDEFFPAFDTAYGSCNTITVSDTGTGMSLGELRENFLTLGTPSRKKDVDEAIRKGAKKPPFLGEKGIGRLSAMRLGSGLRIETAREQDVYFSVLDIDWDAFADVDLMVQDIPVDAARGSKKLKSDWSGTSLSISNLSDDWTEKKLQLLATNEFSRIADPFSDPKKRPRIAIYWNSNRLAIPWLDKTLLENCHAKFSGKFIYKPAEEGKEPEPELHVTMQAMNLGYSHPAEQEVISRSAFELESLLSGVGEEEVPHSALASVGPFEFECFWYNRRHLSTIDSIGNQKAVRDLQRRWAGIMLFRDGFRVFPYGDEDDDWLGLDQRALGRPGYGLNKAQLVGHVNIGRTTNPNLVDQTNREGLRQTPEERALISIMGYVIKEALWHFLREMDRKYKKIPVDLRDLKEDISSLERRSKVALGRVRKFIPKDQQDILLELQSALDEFQDLSTKAQIKIDQVEADNKQMIQMAGIGLMVEVIAHELARSSENALEALEALKGKDLPSEVRARIETLRAEMKSVSKRLRVLDQLSVSGRQRSEVFDLVELAKDLEEGHSAQFKRHGIKFSVTGAKSVRVRAVKGMVVQIFENLLSNAVYWTDLQSKRKSGHKPSITIDVSADPPEIVFFDNGTGVTPENQEKVFRPFWSLKEKSKRRGLGLYIAKENANYLGGDLSLSPEKDKTTGHLHKFVLTLPESAVVK